MKYVGDGFIVDAAAYTVERDGVRVNLEPQAMDLLLFMIERPDTLLSKAELLDNVWGDQFVGDGALATRIKQVRGALGDDGRAQRVIKTVHGRGYRFVGALIDVTDQPRGDQPERLSGSVSGSAEAGGDPVVAAGASGPTIDLTDPAQAERDSSDLEVRHNIPAARTELIGRTELLAAVADATQATRLVSLIGLGGAGKTTLAQEVARRRVADFPDGVWFVDLIPVDHAAAVDGAVARAVGLQMAPGATRADLLAAIADRRLLLVLDNCEHINDAVADFTSDLLDSTRGPQVLTTTREPLRVVGERRIAVGPLPVIADDGGAIDLLDAVAGRYGTTIPEADRVAAIELCTAVDGLPLAIELVGARLPLMSAPELLQRLGDDGTATGRRDRRPDRHASLATILSDTLKGLPRPVVRLLTVLSRVEGAFGIDDIESLGHRAGVADPAGAFATLVDHSLVTANHDVPRRHFVLETVRQHTEAHDQRPIETARAHAAWCLDSVGSTLADHFYDLARTQWTLDHYADVLIAERHLVDDRRADSAAALVAATGLAMHLDDGSRAAHMLTLIDRHAADVTDPALCARLHCTGVMAAMAARVPLGMYEHGQGAVEAADQTDDLSLQGLSRVMRSWAGVVVDADQARADVDAAIELADRVGDDATALIAAGYKSFHLAMGLRFDEAIEIGLEALQRQAPASSYPRRVVLTGLVCFLAIDQPAEALAFDNEIRASVRSAGFWGTTIVRAIAQAVLGDTEAAVAECDRLRIRLDRAGVSPLPDLLLVPAALAHAAGDGARASRYLGAVRAASEPTQSLMVSAVYRVMRSHLSPVAPDDLEATTEQIWSEAQAWVDSLGARP